MEKLCGNEFSLHQEQTEGDAPAQANLVKLMRAKPKVTSTTTASPITNRRRLLFKPNNNIGKALFNFFYFRLCTLKLTGTVRQIYLYNYKDV